MDSSRTKPRLGTVLYDRGNPAAAVKMFSTITQVIPESYRPTKFVSVGEDAITGQPDLDSAGTSHVERKNASPMVQATTAFDLRLLAFLGQSACCAGAPFRILQSVQDSRIASRDSSNGGGVIDHVWDLKEVIAV